MTLRPARPPTLFRQVYFHGLALLVLVALTLGVAGFFLGRDGHWRTSPSRLAQHAGSILASAPDDALPRLVEQLADELDVSVAVYSESGRLLVAAGPRPPLAVARSAGASVHPAHFRRFGGAAPAGHGRSLRLVLNAGEGDWLLRVFGTLALVVGVVALVSAPLARAIARPIERLAFTARRLGQGDLAARSGLSGRGEIGALGRTFDEMAERLERLLRAQRQLLADVSHELRTPLARIRVSLALAGEGRPGDASRHRQAIEEDVAALETLIGDLLTASRLDAGGALVLHRESVDARVLTRQALERLERLHPGRRVEMGPGNAEATAWPALTLSAEQALLARVLDNLLDNAARYSEGPVELAVEALDEGVVWTVRDHGIGISPEDQAQLFTPFFRTDRSRDRHTGGAGLGLLLSKRIVEAHGGTLALKSRTGEGTRVTVWLPAATVPRWKPLSERRGASTEP